MTRIALGDRLRQGERSKTAKVDHRNVEGFSEIDEFLEDRAIEGSAEEVRDSSTRSEYPLNYTIAEGRSSRQDRFRKNIKGQKNANGRFFRSYCGGSTSALMTHSDYTMLFYPSMLRVFVLQAVAHWHKSQRA